MVFATRHRIRCDGSGPFGVIHAHRSTAASFAGAAVRSAQSRADRHRDLDGPPACWSGVVRHWLSADVDLNPVTKQGDDFAASSARSENHLDRRSVTVARRTRAHTGPAQAKRSQFSGTGRDSPRPRGNAARATSHPVHHNGLPHIQRHVLSIMDAQIGISMCRRCGKECRQGKYPKHDQPLHLLHTTSWPQPEPTFPKWRAV